VITMLVERDCRELDDSIRPQKITIYKGGTPRGDRRLERNPRLRRPCCLGGKKPGLWAGPTSRRRRPTDYRTQY
jgi:hypothetical protein